MVVRTIYCVKMPICLKISPQSVNNILKSNASIPNAILFFRLGDFYETFDQDAETASKELDIVLTSRPVAKGVRIPMAGIPHHAAENYMQRLIEKGFHVAICEQVGEQPVKGLFPRQVTRVVTPGTVTEPGLLPGDANNYLACVVLGQGVQETSEVAGIAYVDITTGEFAFSEFEGRDLLAGLRAELVRLHPAEILYPEGQFLGDGLPGHLTPWPAWKFEPGRCEQVILNHFQATTLDGFGLQGMAFGLRAVGAVLQYVEQTQPASLKLLNRLSSYHFSEFMTLDAATRRNLELTETLRGGVTKGSLLGVLDHTVTPMGKRMIQQWVSKPLLDVSRIRQRQEGVRYFYDSGLVRAELRSALKPLADLERLANRVVSGSAIPRDLVAMRHSLESLPAIKNVFESRPEPLANLLGQFDLCNDELQLLLAALADDPPATLQTIGVIRPGYSAELDGVVERTRYAREWIASLEQVERERTRIKTLKVGYNKVFGYYIEISRSNA
ncbi:MAG: DNA mismatch repair protein MutS, partial [Geobacteraceae bacterium]